MAWDKLSNKGQPIKKQGLTFGSNRFNQTRSKRSASIGLYMVGPIKVTITVMQWQPGGHYHLAIRKDVDKYPGDFRQFDTLEQVDIFIRCVRQMYQKVEVQGIGHTNRWRPSRYRDGD